MEQQNTKSLHKYDSYNYNKFSTVGTTSKGDLEATLGGNDWPKQEVV